MEVTCYSDGLACPGGCDAHVVFKGPAHNSEEGVVRNAYAEGTRSDPKPCKRGKSCTVCFSAAAKDCITTIYRGGGPPRGTFDVTPKLLRGICFLPETTELRSELPEGLKKICKGMADNIRRLGRKVNCIGFPLYEGCKPIIEAHAAIKRQDKAAFEECMRLGQDKYNKKHKGQGDRSQGCFYFKSFKALAHKDESWQSMSPSACPDGSFVNSHGLDCCSADDFQNACSGSCGGFYVPAVAAPAGTSKVQPPAAGR